MGQEHAKESHEQVGLVQEYEGWKEEAKDGRRGGRAVATELREVPFLRVLQNIPRPGHVAWTHHVYHGDIEGKEGVDRLVVAINDVHAAAVGPRRDSNGCWVSGLSDCPAPVQRWHDSRESEGVGGRGGGRVDLEEKRVRLGERNRGAAHVAFPCFEPFQPSFCGTGKGWEKQRQHLEPRKNILSVHDGTRRFSEESYAGGCAGEEDQDTKK